MGPRDTSSLSHAHSICMAPFVFLFAYKDAWGVTKGLHWTPLSTEIENFYYASW